VSSSVAGGLLVRGLKMQARTSQDEQCSSHALRLDLAGLGLGLVSNASIFVKSTKIDQIVAMLGYNVYKHGLMKL